MTVDGIDVSAEQGLVDWHLVPGILGIAKATEGDYYQDSLLHPNLVGLAGNGLRAGAYHFIRAGINWQSQAGYFTSFVGEVFGDDILALDLEPYPGEPWPMGPDETVANAMLFLSTVRADTNLKPWLYTYPSFMDMLLISPHAHDLQEFPLWWADPSGTNPAPWPPALIQTGQGTVAGVGGAVDLNSLGPAYQSTVTPTLTPGDEMPLYTATDNGNQTFYRDAAGIAVPLSKDQAAEYYPAIVAGKIAVVDLGGVLGVVAHNQATVKALKETGVILP